MPKNDWTFAKAAAVAILAAVAVELLFIYLVRRRWTIILE